MSFLHHKGSFGEENGKIMDVEELEVCFSQFICTSVSVWTKIYKCIPQMINIPFLPISYKGKPTKNTNFYFLSFASSLLVPINKHVPYVDHFTSSL